MYTSLCAHVLGPVQERVRGQVEGGDCISAEHIGPQHPTHPSGASASVGGRKLAMHDVGNHRACKARSPTFVDCKQSHCPIVPPCPIVHTETVPPLSATSSSVPLPSQLLFVVFLVFLVLLFDGI